MASNDEKAAWGDAVPPASTNAPVAPANDETAANDQAPAASVPATPEVPKIVVDTSQYPSHWVFSDTQFEDGTPRVKMWRDPYGAAPHSADVHPNEVPDWSQMGWNIGDLPPKEAQQ